MNAAADASGPIIVIDDDQTMRRACEAALRRSGYQVETFPDGASGLERAKEVRPGVLITDLKMPGMSGIEVIHHVKEIDPDIVVVVITGFATVDTAVEAMKGGAYDFIPKPFTADELRVIIRRAVERHRLSMEAKRLRVEKEAQARKFVTFVSHQLQSPLGAVQQYLEVLLHQMGSEIPEKHRQWIDRSSKKIAEMLKIIADWLTFSKVEGGTLATERKLLRWQDLAAETLESFVTTAVEKQVTLVNEVPDDLPSIIGDESALRMLLSNLVSNAIKYNRAAGRVTVAAEADERVVRLSVTDTGIGIAADQLPHVFEEFYRVKDGSTVGTGGTGMGLAICKKIAEELGGDMRVTSEPGAGSTFTVVLPREGIQTNAPSKLN
ncbi:MAG: hybrid sensor histidine kinase/response regulator [Phycisphaerae bacterium]|nr:hybrid sensor histidine kinase/response regulator [Phycisphaerae bacterium]